MPISEKQPGQDLKLKQQQFNAAMELFEDKWIYQFIGKMVSFTNVTLQVYLLWLVLQLSIGPPWQLFSLAAAFLIADFINGLVHLYMDNNDNYASPAGPLIAGFHLHHKTPLYKKSSLFSVYFHETGSKIWLIPFLAVSAVLILGAEINPVISYILVYTGILSSVAEVTHYRCHVPDSRLAKYIDKLHLVLSKRHHGRHHIEDNVSYAFLNGFTDPVLDCIAKKFFQGYKNTTDLHYSRYTGKGTANRE